MKRCILTVTLVAMALVMASVAWPGAARAGVPEPLPAAPAAWTVALYVNADNNLADDWASFDRPELRRLSAQSGVNIVAMVDRRKRGGVQLLGFGDGTVRVLATYDEMNFGDGDTFAWFLGRVTALFPSEHLLVGAWDHGDAWHGFSWDDSSREDCITMPELRGALVQAGVDIDIMAFDTCLSASVEVAYDIALTQRVRYMVASEDFVALDGFSYDAMLAPLAADPGRSPETVLGDLLTGWQRYYRGLRHFTGSSLSAIDLPRVLAMRGDLQTWAALLRAGIAASGERYAADLRTVIYPQYTWQVDLGSIATRLADDTEIADAELRAASRRVADGASAAVLGKVSGSYATAYTGLTLWWGTGSDWLMNRREYAREPAFAAETGWHGFLREFNASPAADTRYHSPGVVRSHLGLNDVLFSDARHGCAAGYDNRREEALLLYTADGGATWRRRSESMGFATLTSLASRGGRRLVTVGSSGAGSSTTLGSADDGKTWSLRHVKTNRYLLGVQFSGGKQGWAVGTSGTLLRTVDGGLTWRRPAGARLSRDLAAVALAGGKSGWVAGNEIAAPRGTVYHTVDGGRTLIPQATFEGTELAALAAPDPLAVWAAGGDPAGGHGLIAHSADGGLSWATQLGGVVAPRLADILMVDVLRGWAVGDGGTVLRTVDGGASWVQQVSGTSEDLAAITFADAQHAFIVGDGDTVVTSSDGGATWAAQPLEYSPHRAPTPASPQPVKGAPASRR